MKSFFALLSFLILLASCATASAYAFTSEHGFSLEIPDSWNDLETTDPYSSLEIEYVTEDDYAHISVSIPLKLKAGETLDNVLAENEAMKASQYEIIESMIAPAEFTLLSENTGEVNGMGSFEYSYIMGTEGFVLEGKQVAIEAENHLVLFTLTALEGGLEDHNADFLELLTSFQPEGMDSAYHYTDLYLPETGTTTPSLISDPARSMGWIIGFALIPIAVFIAVVWFLFRKK